VQEIEFESPIDNGENTFFDVKNGDLSVRTFLIRGQQEHEQKVLSSCFSAEAI
jgi:hypothetical protein